MAYKLTRSDIVIRLFDGASIPADTANTDYQEFLAWTRKGHVPTPADPVPAADYAALRASAYKVESDPLFFSAQRGEATKQDWLDKVAEIKIRHPKGA